MKKELYYKISSVIFIVSLLLINIAPFSHKTILANGYINAPFVGYNYNIIHYGREIDRIYSLSSQASTGTFETTGNDNYVVQGPYTSNGQTYYSSGVGGGVHLQGEINLSLSNSLSSTQMNYYYRVIECEVILNDNYVGYVTFSYNGNTSGSNTIFINGNSFTFSIVDNNSDFTSGNYTLSITNYSLSLNNLNERWTFPIESFNVCYYGLNHFNLVEISPYNDYYFPIFNVPTNTYIYEDYTYSVDTRFVFMVNKNLPSLTSFTNNFETNYGEFKNFKSISRFQYNGQFYYLISIDISGVASGGSIRFKYKGSGDILYMPVYYGRFDKGYFSTDFALQFGLSNSLLDKLEIIAYGNTQSNNSSSQADTTNSQAASTFAQEEQLVDNAEQDLNNKLNSLDIQNKNNSLFGNSKFIASANWVKTQFNTITNNNAFNYLITFSLVIGLSLVIIGKLRG